MFQLSVKRVFSAAHALTLGGAAEPLHGHDWRVTVIVAGDRLDADGLLCDFHALEEVIDAVIAPFQNANLNDAEAFRGRNASAERVAQHIAERLRPGLPAGVRLDRVSVTEAPGCEATFVVS
ncbi:MAG: 6-carboxytetrahydropterin synthase [Phycisphaerales bacterium]|nr:6-carboxytetrahydropterin synthase [Phycisphaerales bacterium]